MLSMKTIYWKSKYIWFFHYVKLSWTLIVPFRWGNFAVFPPPPDPGGRCPLPHASLALQCAYHKSFFSQIPPSSPLQCHTYTKTEKKNEGRRIKIVTKNESELLWRRWGMVRGRGPLPPSTQSGKWNVFRIGFIANYWPLWAIRRESGHSLLFSSLKQFNSFIVVNSSFNNNISGLKKYNYA